MERIGQARVQKCLRRARAAFDIEVLCVGERADRLRVGEGAYAIWRCAAGQHVTLRAAVLDPRKPYIESGPVCFPCASTHQDRILTGTLAMHMRADNFAGDPLVLPRLARDETVFGHGKLKRHEGATLCFAGQETRKARLCIRMVEHIDCDPGLA